MSKSFGMSCWPILGKESLLRKRLMLMVDMSNHTPHHTLQHSLPAYSPNISATVIPPPLKKMTGKSPFFTGAWKKGEWESLWCNQLWQRRGVVVTVGWKLMLGVWFLLVLNNCIVQWAFLPKEIQVAFPRPTQSMVHAGCFRASIFHQTLIWSAGSLTRPQKLMHAITRGGVRTQ